MSAFVPCVHCRRHVRAGESSCPFCDGAMPETVRAVPAANRRMNRGALFAFAASMSVAACGGQTDDKTTDAAVTSDGGGDAEDTGGGGALYGAPADTGVVDTGPEDTGGGGALYGAPADTGPDDTGAPDADDDGGPAPAYGLPPTDAG